MPKESPVSAFEAELASQMLVTESAIATAEHDGDDVLAAAMRGRLDELVGIAARQVGEK